MSINKKQDGCGTPIHIIESWQEISSSYHDASSQKFIEAANKNKQASTYSKISTKANDLASSCNNNKGKILLTALLVAGSAGIILAGCNGFNMPDENFVPKSDSKLGQSNIYNCRISGPKVSGPKEYRESFEEKSFEAVVIEEWRNKIAKESHQMLIGADSLNTPGSGLRTLGTFCSSSETQSNLKDQINTETKTQQLEFYKYNPQQQFYKYNPQQQNLCLKVRQMCENLVLPNRLTPGNSQILTQSQANNLRTCEKDYKACEKDYKDYLNILQSNLKDQINTETKTQQLEFYKYNPQQQFYKYNPQQQNLCLKVRQMCENLVLPNRLTPGNSQILTQSQANNLRTCEKDYKACEKDYKDYLNILQSNLKDQINTETKTQQLEFYKYNPQQQFYKYNPQQQNLCLKVRQMCENLVLPNRLTPGNSQILTQSQANNLRTCEKDYKACEKDYKDYLNILQSNLKDQINTETKTQQLEFYKYNPQQQFYKYNPQQQNLCLKVRQMCENLVLPNRLTPGNSQILTQSQANNLRTCEKDYKACEKDYKDYLNILQSNLKDQINTETKTQQLEFYKYNPQQQFYKYNPQQQNLCLKVRQMCENLVLPNRLTPGNSQILTQSQANNLRTCEKDYKACEKDYKDYLNILQSNLKYQINTETKTVSEIITTPIKTETKLDPTQERFQRINKRANTDFDLNTIASDLKLDSAKQNPENDNCPIKRTDAHHRCLLDNPSLVHITDKAVNADKNLRETWKSLSKLSGLFSNAAYANNLLEHPTTYSSHVLEGLNCKQLSNEHVFTSNGDGHKAIVECFPDKRYKV